MYIYDYDIDAWYNERKVIPQQYHIATSTSPTVEQKPYDTIHNPYGFQHPYDLHTGPYDLQQLRAYDLQFELKAKKGRHG